MNEAELYSWEFYNHPDGGKRLRGIVKNDKADRWPDGRRVFTSLVLEQTGLKATTEHTIYHLKGDWKGPWSYRDLDMKIVEETGEVHFDNVRNGARIGY